MCIVGVARIGESLFDLKGTNIGNYAWGLGEASNIIIEAYAIYIGLKIVIQRNISKIVIFGDSIMVVQAIIKSQLSGNNQYLGILHCILSIQNKFEEFKIYHIKRDLNTLVDQWEILVKVFIKE